MLKITKTVQSKFVYTISRNNLRKALAAIGVEIPLNARFFVEVPWGGDWSGTDLDLDDNETALRIDWETIETTQEGDG